MNNNVKSNLWLSNMIIPKMAEAGGGKVIVISSIAGITGSDVLGAYSISKTADLGLVRSLAVEYMVLWAFMSKFLAQNSNFFLLARRCTLCDAYAYSSWNGSCSSKRTYKKY